MKVLAMDALPDCVRCGSAVVAEIEDDTLRPIEVCVACDLSQPVMPSFLGIPSAVRVVRLLGADVQPVLCRACTRGQHAACWRVRCTCNHPEVPDAPA